jgi:murein DD-endopeptidase MepM/ murein hydrolase activator NlpD
MRRLALLAPLGLLLAFGSAGAGGPARKPGASSSAWAIRVAVPNGDGAGTATVSSPPGKPVVTGGFAYPSDGSAVSAGATTVSASTDVTVNAAAKADASVTSLSIFGGEITADEVRAASSAGTGPSGANGNFIGTGVTNLQALGQSVGAGRVALADWGYLTVAAEGTDTTAPEGAKGYRGFVTALDIHLNADHGGLPAGTEIQVGYAVTAVQTAPPAARTGTGSVAAPSAEPTPEHPSKRPLVAPKKKGSLFREPLKVHPKLSAGRYVFPVYGPSSYIDTYGGPRADVTYHHGDDIFGQLGQPLLAVADGTVFSVGWNDIGGNRLWLRDGQGNEFYYAHLSAFSTLAQNGAHVKAGMVVGFMGRTGDAEGTPYHLHFEVHPVSLLYLGYDGAVDPTAYLDAWSHARDLPFPVAPGGGSAPEPGAILLGMNDISSADGLDPASLRRALVARAPVGLPPSGVPTTVPPSGDLGRG